MLAISQGAISPAAEQRWHSNDSMHPDPYHTPICRVEGSHAMMEKQRHKLDTRRTQVEETRNPRMGAALVRWPKSCKRLQEANLENDNNTSVYHGIREMG
ncbi:hypothetical protein BV25DRAFT_1824588 [Artomyces pyxidatus]|uniref:Uncharacterized protein n=1 Tax=Artomyces pyxidatus TaxID=48021 RepID=A0ACB8T4Y4_9AGAM|nr:hypothetical protein BV25DRAFT_1824588 [Artomyces pyxidatus]